MARQSMETRRRRRLGIPGTTRIRLPAMIAYAFDLPCEPEDIWQQKGFWATAKGDCAAWGADVGYVRFASWDTMTHCVRFGFSAFIDGTNGYEISARTAESRIDVFGLSSAAQMKVMQRGWMKKFAKDSKYNNEITLESWLQSEAIALYESKGKL